MYADTSLVFSLRYKIILVFIIHELDFNFLFQQNSENHTRTKNVLFGVLSLGVKEAGQLQLL